MHLPFPHGCYLLVNSTYLSEIPIVIPHTLRRVNYQNRIICNQLKLNNLSNKIRARRVCEEHPIRVLKSYLYHRNVVPSTTHVQMKIS